eukprot:264163-Pyramimonas_sp.AAC.1
MHPKATEGTRKHLGDTHHWDGTRKAPVEHSLRMDTPETRNTPDSVLKAPQRPLTPLRDISIYGPSRALEGTPGHLKCTRHRYGNRKPPNEYRGIPTYVKRRSTNHQGSPEHPKNHKGTRRQPKAPEGTSEPPNTRMATARPPLSTPTTHSPEPSYCIRIFPYIRIEAPRNSKDLQGTR